VDSRKELKEKKMLGSFTSALLEKIKETLANKKQAIIFQNRRGYAPYVNCEICGHVPECPSCDVSLTYHQFSRELRCHYCGHHEPIPPVCPSCGSVGMKPVGFGTEKLEEELALIFPAAKVKRMDQDTTRNKNAFKELITALEKQEIDILVGTQMVSKGFDFEHVSLVGVLDVDRALHYPDFRSGERVFQLLTQVSGRAGRRSIQGQVIIQTNQPQNSLLNKVVENNYSDFFKDEIVERGQFNYPPFSRIIKIEIKNKDKEIGLQAAAELTAELCKRLGSQRILGPEAPLMEKLRDLYLGKIGTK
jgi:primosomal protein N' (replication factor Y)